MNPRPEIVLPPGFALRIDYDPESVPASLLITAYRDDAPVGQAHVEPREIGQRLRLEVDVENGASEHPLRLRLTPQRAMRSIEMGLVQVPMPPRDMPAIEEPDVSHVDRRVEVEMPAPATLPEQCPAMDAVQALARDGALAADAAADHEPGAHHPNSLVWLEHGGGVVLPAGSARRPLTTLAARVSVQLREELVGADRAWSQVQRAVRALGGAAADVLGNPLRLREADESWISWRGSWRAARQAAGAGEG